MTVEERVLIVLANEWNTIPDQILKETPLYQDVTLDNLMAATEEEFNVIITAEDQQAVETVGELIELVKLKVGE